MTERHHAPLDAEERALRAGLPRLLGRGEPGPGVDARVLAAARAAATPAAGAARHRRRWVAPLGVAATVIVAAGLAWQLLPPQPAPRQASEVAASDAGAQPQAERAPPPTVTPPDDARAAPPSPPVAVPAPPRPRASASPELMPAEAAVAAPLAATGAPAPPPPAAAVPPAPPAPPPTPAPVAIAPERAEVAGVATSELAQPQAAMPKPAAASGATPRMAARAGPVPARPAAVMADEPDDDIPPATVDAPGVREAWLRRIGELVAEGRTEEARESLAVFRKRYPDAVLPPELRPLEVRAETPPPR